MTGSSIFEQAFDQAAHLMMLVDRDGRVRAANATMAAAVRQPREALVGMGPALFPFWHMLGDAGHGVRRLMAQALAGERARLETMITLFDEPPRWIEFTATPLRDAAGAVECVLLEGRDQTRRHEAEGARREIGAMASMGTMAARLAHQVNNPLAGIQNAFLLVRDAIPPDHPHARFVEAIDREIARIAAITRQLVETYRPDQALAAEASVILAVHDAAHFLRQLHAGRSLTVTTDVAAAPSSLAVPDALLRQTLYNLLQQAADRVPDGGTVAVRVARVGDACQIHVWHGGATLTDEERARLFEPVAGPVARGERASGGGIGLALVRQSVVAVGGTLSAHPVAGGGTCYDVTFPLTSLAEAMA
jgi:signal transduction histidine kinase